MFKPYFKYVNAPGVGGKVLEHTSLYIKSETQLCSVWAGEVIDPYRDLQFGGIELGFRGHNYWFVKDSFLERIISFIV